MPPRETRRLLMLACSLAIAGCAGGRVTMPGAVPAVGGGERLRIRVAGRIQTVPLEEYVLGAALSEVSPVGEPPRTVDRMFEVQAVIARSYAAAYRGRHSAEGFDLCDQTHCQLYEPGRIRTSRFAAAASAAVTRTRGRVVRMNGRPIEALFHADCGGHTTTPAAAWNGTNLPYLPARPDTVPGANHRQWAFEATWVEWRALLDGDPRTSVGPVNALTVLRRGPGDRVTAVQLAGARTRETTGEVLRTVVNRARGTRAVMSTRFTVHRTDTGVRLEGTGFGHGVGLCQVGALARARRGDDLTAILSHYYPGTTLGPM
jgi:stage II sporulation protein D